MAGANNCACKRNTTVTQGLHAFKEMRANSNIVLIHADQSWQRTSKRKRKVTITGAILTKY